MTKQNQPSPHAGFAARLAPLLQVKADGNASECARAMGCSPQAVSKWLAGAQMPRGVQVEKLAAWLDTTPGYLRFGQGAETGPAPPDLKFVLMWVEAEREVPLLNDFRQGTDRGQKQLLAAANRMEKMPADDRPPLPPSPYN